MQKQNFKRNMRLLYWMLPLALSSSTLFASGLGIDERSGWDFGIQALYLKALYSGDLSFTESFSQVAPNVIKRDHLKANWGWGFRLEGSYHFCPRNDFNINWYHYKKTTNGSFIFETIPVPDTYRRTSEWNAVNLEFGQSLHVDLIQNLRLHGGLQLVQIKTKYRSNGIDPDAIPGSEHYKMKFNGIGPRIGADISVGLFKTGLTGYLGGDVALLVGESKFNFNETFGTPTTISGKRPIAAVPELGLKIGAQYDFAFSCSHLLIDAGYLVVNYFNTQNLENAFTLSESNFALSGFYLGLKWEPKMVAAN